MKSNSKYEQHKKVLRDAGISENIIAKLSDKQVEGVAYYIENFTFESAEDLYKRALKLAILEKNGKTGASYLVNNKISNVDQLKILSNEQIEEIIAEFEITHDKRRASELAYDFITDKLNHDRSEKLSDYF